MDSYATTEQLAQWLQADPADNATPLLRSATILVALACFRNPYSDPAPSVDDAAVLADATCAQVAAWIALGINPAQLGIAPGSAPIKSSTILGGTVQRDTTGQTALQVQAATMLAPEVRDILTLSGLIYEPVPIAADFNDLPYWGSERPFVEWPGPWWP